MGNTRGAALKAAPGCSSIELGEIKMTTDASDLLLPHVRQFTVGFVLNDPPAPRVLGSGVLVRVGSLSGILTCAHVADEYQSRTEIGVVRFTRDAIVQRHKLTLGETTTIKIGGPPWTDPWISISRSRNLRTAIWLPRKRHAHFSTW